MAILTPEDHPSRERVKGAVSFLTQILHSSLSPGVVLLSPERQDAMVWGGKERVGEIWWPASLRGALLKGASMMVDAGGRQNHPSGLSLSDVHRRPFVHV